MATIFLESTSQAVERLINSTDSVGKKVHTVLVRKLVRTDWISPLPISAAKHTA